jgi:tRNA (cmo5U34)-methyltransferase
VNADLASDLTSSTYESLLGVWFRLMIEAGHTPDKLENLRVAYGRDVALLPLAEVSTLMSAGGFTTPVLFLQTCLIHAWYARTPAGV